jgi:hypothetical protein
MKLNSALGLAAVLALLATIWLGSANTRPAKLRATKIHTVNSFLPFPTFSTNAPINHAPTAPR